jgi:hypothetical protein
MSSLINISSIDLMLLWGELVEAYYGVNRFGSYTAEIYAYHFSWREMFVNKNDKTKHYQELGEQLLSLVKLFCDKYECSAEINGILLKDFKKPFYFDHRCSVKIDKKK